MDPDTALEERIVLLLERMVLLDERIVLLDVRTVEEVRVGDAFVDAGRTAAAVAVRVAVVAFTLTGCASRRTVEVLRIAEGLLILRVDTDVRVATAVDGFATEE